MPTPLFTTGVLQSKGVDRVTLDELVADTLPHARGKHGTPHGSTYGAWKSI